MKKYASMIMKKRHFVEYFYDLQMTLALPHFTNGICILWVSAIESSHMYVKFSIKFYTFTK